MIELQLYRYRSIVYGITLRNAGRFTARGWTLHPAEDVSLEQTLVCRSALAEQLGFAPQRLVIARQVHGAEVAVVNAEAPLQPADALVTSTKGVLLCVAVADCCGVMLWDEHARVVAAVHSGWRGTSQRIVQRCIECIECHFDIDPSHLHAWLSPCASGERYVVRHDVARLFPQFVRQVADDQFLFDNRQAIITQLLDSGIVPENISWATECTIADERFHSYRRDGTRAGRMAAFIGICEM